MIKSFKGLLAAILAILVVFSSTHTMESYAYDEKEYDEDSYGWQMDNYHDNGVRVLLYIYTQNNLSFVTSRGHYMFGCYSDNLPERCNGYAQFCRNFLNQGKEEVVELDSGLVYEAEMNIEPGSYCFSYPNARFCDGEKILPLTHDFNSPLLDNGYYVASDVRDENKEIVTLEDGQTYRVYMLYGSDEWRKSSANIYEFKSWAKEFDAAFADQDFKIEKKRIVENGSLEEEEMKKEEAPKKEFVASKGPTRVTEDIVTTIEIPAKETSIPYGFIVPIVMVVGVAIAVYVAIIKKFKEKEE